MIDEQITELKNVFLKSAFHVEKMMAATMKAIKENNIEESKRIIIEMEPVANDYEVQVEQECISVSARFQPEVKNLRTIVMIMKMNVDLERIADMCVNVSDSFMDISNIGSPDEVLKIHALDMFGKASKMYKASISAFINEDINLAKGVLEMDEEVDYLNRKIVKDVVTLIEKKPNLANTYLHYVRMAKNIERIADLSTNVCENVIYMVKGIDVRHNKAGCDNLSE